MQESHVITVMSSHEIRAQELEELRMKQLAKQSALKNDVSIRPIATMDTWLEHQKQEMDRLRKQQKVAKENLMNYRAKDIDNQESVLKEELKRKQIEAAEILHNYRGNKESYIAHEVKKVNKVSKLTSDCRKADVSGPIREDPEFKSIETIRSKFDVTHLGAKPLKENDHERDITHGESNVEIIEQLSGSSNEGSSSWIMVSENKQITNLNASVRSNCPYSNSDNHESIQNQDDFKKEDQSILVDVSTIVEANMINSKDSRMTHDHHDEKALRSDQGENDEIKFRHDTKKGTASVSFGLVTKEKDAAQVGPYSFGNFASATRDGNKILDKLLMSICQIVQSDLKVSIASQDVKLLLNGLSVQVQNDDCTRSQRNSSTVRRYVRIKIPFEVRDINSNLDIQKRIQQTLAASIPILMQNVN